MIDPEAARQAMTHLNVADRSEYAWRLLELTQLVREAAPGTSSQFHDELQYWIQMGAQAGWLDKRQQKVWQRVLNGENVSHKELWGGEKLAIWRVHAAFAPLLGPSMGISAEWPDAHGFLAEMYDISSRDALIQHMLWLSAQGDRCNWDMDARKLQAYTSAERHEWALYVADESEANGLTADEIGSIARYAELLVEFLERGETPEWAAWDWLRITDIAYAGKLIGWLTEQEATLFVAHAVELLQARYTHWEEVAQAYQRGRSLYEGQDETHGWQEEWRFLLKGDLSPWQWPLLELLDETLGHASRDYIVSLRDIPIQFVRALASVREPGLLSRMDIEPDDERKDEALVYLQETLEWGENDGVESLMRFWQPALAHCLNQLACDATFSSLPSVETPFGKADAQSIDERDRIAACVDFPATVFMAEKYAYHIWMAHDAGTLSKAEFTQVAQQLKSTLCSIYLTPKRLLSAWLAWETALPDSEQASLVEELKWQLNDPGALVHWLKWKVPLGNMPSDSRLTLEQFVSLSLGGPLGSPLWTLPQPVSGKSAQELYVWMDTHYGISSAEGLVNFLEFLCESGDRQEYLINYAPYTLNMHRLKEEVAILESGVRSEDEQVHLERLKRVESNTARCNDTDMSAWDTAQIVDLSVAGRYVGWLGPEQLNNYLERASALAASSYASWSDYAQGLYAGFCFFMTEEAEHSGFTEELRHMLVAWLTGAPLLAGGWSAIAFPGQRSTHHIPMHIDMLLEEQHTLH